MVPGLDRKDHWIGAVAILVDLGGVQTAEIASNVGFASVQLGPEASAVDRVEPFVPPHGYGLPAASDFLSLVQSISSSRFAHRLCRSAALRKMRLHAAASSSRERVAAAPPVCKPNRVLATLRAAPLRLTDSPLPFATWQGCGPQSAPFLKHNGSPAGLRGWRRARSVFCGTDSATARIASLSTSLPLAAPEARALDTPRASSF